MRLVLLRVFRPEIRAAFDKASSVGRDDGEFPRGRAFFRGCPVAPREPEAQLAMNLRVKFGKFPASHLHFRLLRIEIVQFRDTACGDGDAGFEIDHQVKPGALFGNAADRRVASVIFLIRKIFRDTLKIVFFFPIKRRVNDPEFRSSRAIRRRRRLLTGRKTQEKSGNGERSRDTKKMMDEN